MRGIQRGISTLIILVIFLVAGIAIVSAYLIFAQNQQKLKSINSFEDCAAAGYPIMESYPEQCNTPEGKHFTRQLTEEKKQNRLVPSTVPSSSVQADETSNWKIYSNKKWNYQIKYPDGWEVLEADLDDVILSSKEKDSSSKANLMKVASKQIRLSVYKRQKGTLEEEAKMMGRESLQCMMGSPCEGRPPEELVIRSDSSVFVKSVDDYFRTLFAFSGDSEKYLIIGNNYPWTSEDREFYEQMISTFKFLE